MATLAGNLGMPTRELKAGRRMRELDIRPATPPLRVSFGEQTSRPPGRDKEKQDYQKPFQAAALSHR